MNRFNTVKGGVNYCLIDKTVYHHFHDLGEKNINQILDREYIYDLFYDNYEELLEYNNVERKNEYLNMIQYIDSLVDFKLKEIIENEDYDEKHNRVFLNSSIEGRIKFRMKFNGVTEGFEFDDDDGNDSTQDESFDDAVKGHKNETLLDESNSDASCHYCSTYEYLFNEVSYYVKKELKQRKVKLNSIQSIFSFLWFLQPFDPDYNYYSIVSSKIFIIFLFKTYHDSGKFGRFYKNLASLKKKIYILKLEDFNIDQNIIESNNESLAGVFDLYKHQDECYDGYEFRRLIDELINIRHLPLNVCFSFKI